MFKTEACLRSPRQCTTAQQTESESGGEDGGRQRWLRKWKEKLNGQIKGTGKEKIREHVEFRSEAVVGKSKGEITKSE